MLCDMTSHLTIVTGSSRGVGAALAARLLSRPGQRVLGMARHANPALAALADTHGALLEQWTVDLADAAPVAARLQAWLAALDPAELASATLVNNAATVSTPAAAHRAPAAEQVRALRVGLEAPLLLSAAFIAATEAWALPKRLMNISSGLGRRAMAGSAAYCAVKAGLDHFSRALALEQAGAAHPVQVEAVAPGVIDTDMQVLLRSADPALFPERERFVQLHAQGQLLTPNACAALLLARLDRSDYGRETVTDVRNG